MRHETRAAIQWTNTDACIDVWCECGADLHLDGTTSGRVQCPRCHSEWILDLRPRTPDANDYPHEPTMLSGDDEP